MKNTIRSFFKAVAVLSLSLAAVIGTVLLVSQNAKAANSVAATDSQSVLLSKAACSHSNKTRTIIAQAGCSYSGKARYRCNSCGKTWEETIPATGHSYVTKTIAATCQAKGRKYLECTRCGSQTTTAEYPKVAHQYNKVVAAGSYYEVHCTMCNIAASRFQVHKSLDDFAYMLYGKSDYYQLRWFSVITASQQTEARRKWISYSLHITYSEAKKFDKNYSSLLLKISIKDVQKLTNFIGKCNTLASKFNFTYATQVKNLLGKISFITCMVDTGISDWEKALTILQKISPVSAEILKSYSKIYKAMEDLVVAGSAKDILTDMGTTCEKYYYNFDVFNPTAVRKDKNGKSISAFDSFTANIDNICFMTFGVSYSTICSNKDYYTLYYNVIKNYILKPILNQEFKGCISGYDTIDALLNAAKANEAKYD